MMDISERLLVAGKHLGKCLAGYRDGDLKSAARSAVDLDQLMFDAADEIDRLRALTIRPDAPKHRLNVKSICGSTKDRRILEVWLADPVTRADRDALTAELSRPQEK